jgi:hypothetical protein
MVSEGSFLFLGEQATRCLAGPPYYRVGVYVCQPWQQDYFSVIYQAIGRSVGHLSSGVVVVDPFFFFLKKEEEGRTGPVDAHARGDDETGRSATMRRACVSTYPLLTQ